MAEARLTVEIVDGGASGAGGYQGGQGGVRGTGESMFGGSSVADAPTPQKLPIPQGVPLGSDSESVPDWMRIPEWMKIPGATPYSIPGRSSPGGNGANANPSAPPAAVPASTATTGASQTAPSLTAAPNPNALQSAPTIVSATSDVSAFGRPQPVIIMGPRPLPVSVVKGSLGGSNATGSTGGGGGSGGLRRYAADAKDIIGMVGAGTRGLANNDGMAMIGAASGIAIKGLEKLGPQGAAVAAALSVATTAVTTFISTVDAFVARGRELSGYNADLAASTANQDITRLMADIREADKLGPRLAELIDKQTSLENIFRETMLPVKEVVTDVLVEILGFVKDAIITALEYAKNFSTTAAEALERIKKAERDRQSTNVNSMISDLLTAANGLRLAPATSAAMGAGAARMDVPAFQFG